LIPTFSPQGDGNDFTIYRLVYVDTGVDPYLFPARGRKRFVVNKRVAGHKR